MKIQKRFMRTNMLMVFLALISLGVIAVAVVYVLNSIEQNSFSEVREDVYEIQSDIEEQLDKDIEWRQIDEEINQDSFYLYVTSQGDVVYSSPTLDDSKKDIVNTLQGQTGVYYHRNNAIITFAESRNGREYYVYAIEKLDEPGPSPERENSPFMTRFLIIFVIAVIVILLVSYIFSKNIVRRIMKPVNLLMDSANRIENDDFTTFIEYSGEEEFEVLCHSFNNMQEHLKEEKQKNEAYEQARINMVAGISHDLRTPLTSIKGYVKGMLEGVANTPERQEQYLTTVYRKSCSMEVLLERLLYFSKLETGNLPNIPVKVDLGEMIQSYVEELSVDLEQKNVRVEQDHLGACPVNVDLNQMMRVFDNLFHNTIKYARVKDICIRIKTEVLPDKTVRMIFQDNGVGVEEDKIPHIFKLFYRGDKARTSKTADGSGLGLYIVKYVIETQQGKVYAENENGFKVVITLPLRED